MSGADGRKGGSRGKGKARVKRQEIQSEDGWTVITHGMSKINLDSKKDKKVAGALPSKTINGMTAEKLLSEFEKLQEKWKESAVARQIEELLSSKSWDIHEAACIGIGSFSRDWEHRWRSMWQLVLFMEIIQLLKGSDKNVKIYAQDPAFTTLDIEFLELLNITKMASGIESNITPRCFVFSPFVDWYILLPTFLKDKDPELYVGNEILNDYAPYVQTEDKREKVRECNDLGKALLEGKESVKLKDFEEHAHAFSGMVIYWNSPPTRNSHLEKKHQPEFPNPPTTVSNRLPPLRIPILPTINIPLILTPIRHITRHLLPPHLRHPRKRQIHTRRNPTARPDIPVPDPARLRHPVDVWMLGLDVVEGALVGRCAAVVEDAGAS
jgi:hypothetical protein